MGFLMKRSKPRVFAGWYESFDRPVENPVRQPWRHIADGITADINNLQELHIPSNYGQVTGGGESYEFQPFTSNSGFEIEFWNPVSGVLAQSWNIFFTDSWSAIGGTYANIISVRFSHAPANGGQQIQIAEFANPWSAGVVLGIAQSPMEWNGTTLYFKAWFDDDQYLRMWLNDIYLGAVIIDPSFRLGPGRRAVRFLNGNTNDVWVRWLYHYDRPTSFPTVPWTSSFYDTFNRANGSVNANGGSGWTIYNAAGQVKTNSYASTTGADNTSMAITRSHGATNGRYRIEAVTGGQNGMRTDCDSSLMLCMNAAGTQGLSANIFSDRVYISRFTATASGTSFVPTYTDLATQTVSLVSGMVLAFTVYDGMAWIEANGTRICYAPNVNAIVPATNSWAGLRVEHIPIFVDSQSWNDCRILLAA